MTNTPDPRAAIFALALLLTACAPAGARWRQQCVEFCDRGNDGLQRLFFLDDCLACECNSGTKMYDCGVTMERLRVEWEKPRCKPECAGCRP